MESVQDEIIFQLIEEQEEALVSAGIVGIRQPGVIEWKEGLRGNELVLPAAKFQFMVVLFHYVWETRLNPHYDYLRKNFKSSGLHQRERQDFSRIGDIRVLFPFSLNLNAESASIWWLFLEV
ncbi:hypothetical protein C0J52_28300 [Blattella germanica]|nr:hypothetical protein C0J52_28300 [Blattella germanica]